MSVQWRTLEGSRVAVATPDFLAGGWMDFLAPKYLHHKNSTRYV